MQSHERSFADALLREASSQVGCVTLPVPRTYVTPTPIGDTAGRCGSAKDRSRADQSSHAQ
jgi:hypothetical protein